MISLTKPCRFDRTLVEHASSGRNWFRVVRYPVNLTGHCRSQGDGNCSKCHQMIYRVIAHSPSRPRGGTGFKGTRNFGRKKKPTEVGLKFIFKFKFMFIFKFKFIHAHALDTAPIFPFTIFYLYKRRFSF
jgi:hypothetical protein